MKFDEIINIEKLTELYGNDIEFKNLIKITFLNQIDAQFEIIKNNFEKSEWHEMVAGIHKITPAFGMVGLDKTADILKSIELEFKKEGINQNIQKNTLEFIQKFEYLKMLIINNEFS